PIRPPPPPTPFPYTTLFRSQLVRQPSDGLLVELTVREGARHVLGDRSAGGKSVRHGQRLLVLPEVVGGRLAGDGRIAPNAEDVRSEEHTSELQSRVDLVCRL